MQYQLALMITEHSLHATECSTFRHRRLHSMYSALG